ncbi:hypothetical protein NDU88_004205 [Pleurodeles waltl]|uniref:Uncharacterized protein n=1 Tax=Pleurodeles waltl TaxID=8319 RepID=A0AAV7LHM6_PLEWA|nr:hypothetical protein NDU88_004205 [Pleurodeles waltl]
MMACGGAPDLGGATKAVCARSTTNTLDKPSGFSTSVIHCSTKPSAEEPSAHSGNPRRRTFFLRDLPSESSNLASNIPTLEVTCAICLGRVLTSVCKSTIDPSATLTLSETLRRSVQKRFTSTATASIFPSRITRETCIAASSSARKAPLPGQAFPKPPQDPPYESGAAAPGQV